MNRIAELSVRGVLILPVFVVLVFIHFILFIPGFKDYMHFLAVARGGSAVSIDLEASFSARPGNGQRSAVALRGEGGAQRIAMEQYLQGHGTVFGAREGAQVRTYLGAVLREIERNKKYPPQEQQARHRGTAKVFLIIGSEGTLRTLELYRSSGYRSLDAAALDAVKQSAPFPKFSKDVTVKELPIVLDIEYTLQD